MEYYKLVREFNGEYLSFRSSFISEDKDIFIVSYKVDFFVYPYFMRTKLYAFNNFIAAEEFMSSYENYRFYSDLRLFKCEVENPKECFKICSNIDVSSIEDYYLYNEVSPIKTPPDHTVECDAIKLLERII